MSLEYWNVHIGALLGIGQLEEGTIGHYVRHALELLSMWGSAKMGNFRHFPHGQKGSPHGNNCGKSWTTGILGMTFFRYAKDDVNNISSFKGRWFSFIEYATVCATFHSWCHIVAKKNNFLLF
jgi:hypothetical protein